MVWEKASEQSFLKQQLSHPTLASWRCATAAVASADAQARTAINAEDTLIFLLREAKLALSRCGLGR